MKFLKVSRFWWLVFSYFIAAFIAWGSLVPPKVGVADINHSDLLLHFLAYGLLSFLFLSLSRNNKETRLIIILILIYGAMLEGLQYFTPPREPHLLDYLANVTGVIAGFISLRFNWIKSLLTIS